MSILGIDEVGRGPWAGPLVVAACVLSEPIEGIKDSKQLSPKRRERLAAQIKTRAEYALGWVSANRLDAIGLSAALREATIQAVRQIQVPFHEIIIDGNVNFLADTPLARHVTTVKKADALVDSVSAASIIAKVARDQYMIDISNLYPVYHFEQNVGYGTQSHQQALAKFGPCPEHRFSFRPIQALMKSSSDKVSPSPNLTASNKTRIGSQAETAAAAFLEQEGHKIIARNWRTSRCEIDIVSTIGQSIYFTEVKYRQDAKHGGGLAAVDSDKLKRMNFAAESFLKWNHIYHDPKLAVINVSSPAFTVQDFLILH